jgi:3-hydroxyisobutyrate dehydrogenase-like beta-hydroxyacid dehydrogenase
MLILFQTKAALDRFKVSRFEMSAQTSVIAAAEGAGLAGDACLAILGEGAAGSRLVKTKIPKMTARDFSPQFQLALMDKDLRYFLGLAQSVDRPVPIASLVRSQLQAARQAGLGEQDVSAVFRYVKPGD